MTQLSDPNHPEEVYLKMFLDLAGLGYPHNQQAAPQPQLQLPPPDS